MRRILALKELGAATQSLGTAVGFGVVSVDQVQRAVAALLGEEPQAVQAPAAPVLEAAPAEPVVNQAADAKAKADAMGVLIRSGVDPVEAARQVGLDLGPEDFTGAMPVSLRLPKADAAGLETTGP